MQYPWQVLIIEDEGPWFENMSKFLRSSLRGGASPIAKSVAEADRELDLSYYHVISYDLLMREGGTSNLINVEFGHELLRNHNYRAPFSKPVIYTATLNPDSRDKALTGARIGGEQGAEIIVKPAGHDSLEAEFEELNPKQWSERIVARLNDTPVPGSEGVGVSEYYWSKAPALLPPGLAHVAEKIRGRLRGGVMSDRELIQYAQWFIERTIKLAWMQTYVLARVYNPALVLERHAGNVLDYCGQITEWLGTHKEQFRGEAWANYLRPDSRGAYRALSDGFDAYRKTRNELAHSTGFREDWQSVWESLKVPLRYAMDVAAYWARFPLVCRVQPKGGRWRGQRVAGTSDVWPEIDIENLNLKSPPAENDVLQIVAYKDAISDEVRTRVLRWSPWLKVGPDPSQSGQLRAWLLDVPGDARTGIFRELMTDDKVTLRL